MAESILLQNIKIEKEDAEPETGIEDFLPQPPQPGPSSFSQQDPLGDNRTTVTVNGGVCVRVYSPKDLQLAIWSQLKRHFLMIVYNCHSKLQDIFKILEKTEKLIKEAATSLPSGETKESYRVKFRHWRIYYLQKKEYLNKIKTVIDKCLAYANRADGVSIKMLKCSIPSIERVFGHLKQKELIYRQDMLANFVNFL